MAIRTKKYYHIAAVLILAGIAGFVFMANRPKQTVMAQTAPLCTGYNLQVPSAIPGGSITIGLVGTTAVTNIRDVVFKIDGGILGRGVQSGTVPQWQLLWHTQFSTVGQHSIGAQLFFTDGSTCPIPAVQTSLTSTTTSSAQLIANALPVTFQGLTNQPINFSLNASIGNTATAGVDVTQYTYFNNKSTTLGSITPLDGTSILRLSTGPVAGTGVTTVTASYAGLSRVVSVPITVVAQTATTQTTTTTSGTTSTTSAAPPASTQTSTTTTSAASDAKVAAASTASVEAEKPLKDCVLAKLGDVRYKAISSGQSRPTAAEFASMNECFATRNYVLPSTFVPVPPAQVKDQPETKDVAIQSPTNETAGTTTKLKFKGKAKPNSVVLLYVYSEPLVLSTTADGNGDWSYALEDPLEPGDHEMYAVVAKGDGTYERSSVLDFAIAKAEASPSNPNSYSLKLSTIQPTAKENTRSSLVYIGGIAALTVFMLCVAGFVLWRRQNKKSAVVAESVMPVAIQAVQDNPVLSNQQPQPVATAPTQTAAQQAPLAAPKPTLPAQNESSQSEGQGIDNEP